MKNDHYDKSLDDTKAKSLFNNLKKNVSCDNILKIKEYLTLKQDKSYPTAYYIQNGIISSFAELNNFIMKNLNLPNLYTLFQTYKEFLLFIKNNDTLMSAIGINDNEIVKRIDILDDKMREIIEKQMKAKKTKKNQKDRLRTQRRLIEMRLKVAEIAQTDGLNILKDNIPGMSENNMEEKIDELNKII